MTEEQIDALEVICEAAEYYMLQNDPDDAEWRQLDIMWDLANWERAKNSPAPKSA